MQVWVRVSGVLKISNPNFAQGFCTLYTLVAAQLIIKIQSRKYYHFIKNNSEHLFKDTQKNFGYNSYIPQRTRANLGVIVENAGDFKFTCLFWGAKLKCFPNLHTIFLGGYNGKM